MSHMVAEAFDEMQAVMVPTATAIEAAKLRPNIVPTLNFPTLLPLGLQDANSVPSGLIHNFSDSYEEAIGTESRICKADRRLTR